MGIIQTWVKTFAKRNLNSSKITINNKYNYARFSLYAQDKIQVIQPLNGDPFIGMLETPITSAPIVTKYLSYLPCYRLSVSTNARGVEVGLAHGFFYAWSIH